MQEGGEQGEELGGRLAVRLACACALAVAVAFAATSLAFAYSEPPTGGYLSGTQGVSCSYCHWRWITPPGYIAFEYRPSDGGDCVACHADYKMGEFTGPHANYTATSRKCESCHDVHAASGSEKLLPAATILATCQTCHDLTGGWGPYGAIKTQTGLTPGARHRIDQTSTIPGGDALTGGDATRTFDGAGGLLTCTDCHSPHGSSLVAPFPGNRSRVRAFNLPAPTSKLVRRKPTGASVETTEYGTDWCLACHAGRSSGGVVHNHPVDSRAARADAFIYRNVAIVSTDAPTTSTVMAPLGGIKTLATDPDGLGRPHVATWTASPNASGNRGYLMPYPRTSDQAGHAPICMQCHGDSRDAGDLDASGRADAVPATVTAADGVVWSSGTSTWTAATADNPRFQTFPHQTVNTRMLVETDDDLCLNCHPPALLP